MSVRFDDRTLCILGGINCPNVNFSLTFYREKCAYNILGQSFVTRRVTLCRIKDTPFSKHHSMKKKENVCVLNIKSSDIKFRKIPE